MTTPYLESNSPVFLDNTSYTLSAVVNPTAENVLINESKIQAYFIEFGSLDIESRRVDRDIRVFLSASGK